MHGGIRIQFLYPPDLVQLTKKHWDEYEKKHSMSIANYHIPNDNHLLQLLNTMYHLSFEQEESRNIAAKVTYLDPQHYSDVLNTSNKPVAFANVIPSPRFLTKDRPLAYLIHNNVPSILHKII